MTRTPMARLPWLIRIRFWVPRKHSWEPKKANIYEYFRKKKSDFIMKCMLYELIILESPHRGDSNEYTQHAIIL